MTLLMRDQENQEIGKEIGKEIGEAMMLALVEKLVAAGRFDAIGKISKDKEYLRQLYKEYHII